MKPASQGSGWFQQNRQRNSPPGVQHNRLWLIPAFLAAPVAWLVLHLVFGVPVASRAGAEWFGFTEAGFRNLFLLAVIVYPILEEIVFRGALQGWLLEKAELRRSFAGISTANVITSLVFAAMHLFNQSLFWAALIVLPSLVFGWAREASSGVVVPILLHMFYNAGFYLLFVAT